MDILTIALLIVCGFVLLVIEAFLVPGFSVPGIAGIVVIFFGIYRAMVAYGAMGAAVAFLVSATATILLLRAALQSRAVRQTTLEHNQKEYRAPDDYRALVGKEGVTLSPLRPAGIAEIEGERMDVVTDGEFLASGTPVKVLSIEGVRIVVTRMERE